MQVPGTWPERRVVALVQTAGRGESQPAQAWPPRPHSVSFCPAAGTHWPFEVQQPPGHDDGSQTHAPLLQRWPVAQARPVPHAHSPAALQLSAVMPHGAQACPDGPHASRPGVLQVLPTQQPEHDEAQPLHAPPTHVSPPGQAAHALPRAPQAVADAPSTQRSPSQQPLGQVAALQPGPASTTAPPAAPPPPSAPPAVPPAVPPPAFPAVPPAALPPAAAAHDARQRPSEQHCCPLAQASPSPHLKVVSFEVSTQTQPERRLISAGARAREIRVTAVRLPPLEPRPDGTPVCSVPRARTSRTVASSAAVGPLAKAPLRARRRCSSPVVARCRTWR